MTRAMQNIAMCLGLISATVYVGVSAPLDAQQTIGSAEGVVPSAGRSDQPQVRDDVFRQYADHVIIPEYPAEAIRKRITGVVVAQFVLDATRRVVDVTVLEAPSREIAEAVKVAIAKWTFRADAINTIDPRLIGQRVSGKLTFYFLEQSGQFVVLGPKDAPLAVPPARPLADERRKGSSTKSR